MEWRIIKEEEGLHAQMRTQLEDTIEEAQMAITLETLQRRGIEEVVRKEREEDEVANDVVTQGYRRREIHEML
jgi:hypothetical protein